MWDWSQLFASFISDISKWQPRLKKVWRVFVAPPAQAFTKMQARMFNTCQAFATLKVDPAPSGHAHANDQRTAYWTSPLE